MIVDQVIRTLKRTPKGELPRWRVEVSAPAEVELDPHDLRELVGNIDKNTLKSTEAEVILVWEASRLSVLDNGPGVDPARIRRRIATRAERWRE